jgi:hypothetical protein
MIFCGVDIATGFILAVSSKPRIAAAMQPGACGAGALMRLRWLMVTYQIICY